MFMLIFSKTLKLSFNLNKDNINQKGNKKQNLPFTMDAPSLERLD